MLKIKNCPVAFSRSVAALAMLLPALLLQPGVARAQQAVGLIPQFEIAGEYSYVRSNPGNSSGAFDLNGGAASFSYNFSDHLSAVGEFTASRFSDLPSGLTSTMYTYLAGPRYSFERSGRWAPFAQALFGVGRLDASSGGINAGENSFAVALGGGLDVHFHSHFSLRLARVDYLMTRFNSAAGNGETQNDLRVSAGIVFRFGSR